LDLLISFMPFFGAVPIAVAAVVIAKLWQQRRTERLPDAPDNQG